MERKRIVKEQNISGNVLHQQNHLKNEKSPLELRKKINRLQRSLAEKENEVWTLKQLLLYK